MEAILPAKEAVHLLSSWELISVYINGGFGEDEELKEALERELAARSLPRPEPAPPAPVPTPAATGPKPMSKETFLSYLLLIYTVTGVLYAWFYLPMRLIRGDFRKDTKHRVIQTGIATAYQILELATLYLVAEI